MTKLLSVGKFSYPRTSTRAMILKMRRMSPRMMYFMSVLQEVFQPWMVSIDAAILFRQQGRDLTHDLVSGGAQGFFPPGPFGDIDKHKIGCRRRDLRTAKMLQVLHDATILSSGHGDGQNRITALARQERDPHFCLL